MLVSSLWLLITEKSGYEPTSNHGFQLTTERVLKKIFGQSVWLTMILDYFFWGEGQITPKKYRTPLVEILLFDLKIPRNPFVLGKISYAICKSELPLVLGNQEALEQEVSCSPFFDKMYF